MNSLESHSEMDERSRLGRSDGYAMGDTETHLHLLSVQRNGGGHSSVGGWPRCCYRYVPVSPLPDVSKVADLNVGGWVDWHGDKLQGYDGHLIAPSIT
jgi:hypothetical protein